MTATTTIRVTRETRDRLGEAARRRGISVAELLSRQAADWQREAWFAEERAASKALNDTAQAEQDLWESTNDAWG